MCEPISMTTAATLALSAAGTGMSVMGQMNQQASAGAQASYMAQVQRQQQMVAKMQADDALKRGEIDAQKQRTVTGQRLGTQTAVLAAQGTDLEGSPSDILGDTAASGELDASTIKANAARAAWGYEVGAANAGANANLYGSFRPSYLGAGASLLMGASSIADKWNKFKSSDPGLPGWYSYGGGGFDPQGNSPTGDV